MKRIYSRVMTMLCATITFMLLTSINAFAADDWATNNYIEVVGQGMASSNAQNVVHGRMLARRAAVADGYRQLAEAVKGVQVESNTNVEMMMLESDEVKLRVSTTIKGAQVVSEREIPGGGYEVTMRMPIYGSSNSLAKAIFPTQPQERENFPKPSKKVSSRGGYTGLIVDCRGLGLKPVMSPVIKNDRGTKIYGYKNLDPDKVIEVGMASYTYNLNKGIERAGSNPLIVKAIRVENHNGDPVVSVADANRILAENDLTYFLEQTNVVFVR